MYDSKNVAHLNRTTAIYLTSNWTTYTAASLISTYAIREIVVESTKCIGTVVTHPITASTRANCELNTVIYRSDANCSIILVAAGIRCGEKSSKKGNNYFEHFYILDGIIALSLDITITNLIKPGFTIFANNKAIRIEIVKSLDTVDSVQWTNCA
jgi:hypothetical protein